MIRWKFWQKDLVAEAPEPEEDPYFWGFALVDTEFDPNFVPLKPSDIEFGELSQTPTEEQERHMNQFTDFTYWKERKPIPPKSALLAPVKLTPSEKQAATLAETLSVHFVGDLKLKPSLQKKIKASKKGFRRVVFDDKGKMKEVKEAA